MNGEWCYIRVLFNDFLDLGLLKVGKLILLHVKNNLSTTSNAGSFSIELDRKAATSAGLPDILLVVI